MIVFVSKSFSARSPIPQPELQSRFERFREELWCRNPHASGMDAGYTVSVSLPIRTPTAARAFWARHVDPVLDEVGLGPDVAQPLSREPNVMYVLEDAGAGTEIDAPALELELQR